MKEYLKEEIATIREIVKLIVIIIIALIGGMVSFLVKFLENEKMFYIIIATISLVFALLFLLVLKKFWNRLYDLKFQLKEMDE